MPDRIIRDELLESERWLALNNNADRLAFVALLLKADAFGNFDAQPFRLRRLWCDFGIGTAEHVAKTLAELADHDLIRLYEADGKRFLHIPRYRQSLRYSTRRVFPESPFDGEALEERTQRNQRVAGNSQGELLEASASAPVARVACSPEVKRSEEKRSEVNEPTAAHRALAAKEGIDCEREWLKFGTHDWKRRPPKDTGRAFTNWLLKAGEYARRDGTATTKPMRGQVAG